MDFQCIESPTYTDYVNAGFEPVGCGTLYVSKIYFFSFILIVGLVILNIFIAIILQGYFQAMEQEKQTINKAVLEQYRDAWSKHDPYATGFIQVGNLINLMHDLDAPLGWDRKIKKSTTKQALFIKLMTLSMPTYSDRTYYHFSDVLDNITLIYVIRKEIEK